MMPFSVLDLSPIVEGASAADALGNTLELARHAEALSYRRFWVAEHHNMPGIASAATAVVIGHVAAGTHSIRVGSGGVMLPNHAPLVIAEQFGTLASLFPGRIDLGLGRAPGTDPVTARALRRELADSADRFPQDVQELQSYFEAPAGQSTRAIPGAGLEVPIWLLGSSGYSAELAAAVGMGFAFAHHFAEYDVVSAMLSYREHFKPSSRTRAGPKHSRFHCLYRDAHGSREFPVRPPFCFLQNEGMAKRRIQTLQRFTGQLAVDVFAFVILTLVFNFRIISERPTFLSSVGRIHKSFWLVPAQFHE